MWDPARNPDEVPSAWLQVKTNIIISQLALLPWNKLDLIPSKLLTLENDKQLMKRYEEARGRGEYL